MRPPVSRMWSSRPPHAQWCLFLDRDGVINSRIMNGYVRDWNEFVFEPGALDALARLAAWAPRIVVVTNQQGVGKGLMTLRDLDEIHERMRAAIADAGGRVDAVEFCPHLASDNCACRKPRTGMATRYLDAHPELDASLSVVVGDTDSDVEMGRRLSSASGGGVTVSISSDDPHADATYANLAAFAAAVTVASDTTADRASHTTE